MAHLFVAAEPINVEDFRHPATGFFHFQPVSDVMAGVVTKKRPCGEWIMHHLMTFVLGCSCGFRTN